MQHQHQQFPSPPAAVAPAPSSYASYAPLPSGLATANAAAMRPQRKNAMTTPSIDRAIEGTNTKRTFAAPLRIRSKRMDQHRQHGISC